MSRDWDETEHPRDPDGQFRDKTSGWVEQIASAVAPRRFMSHAQVRSYADRTDYTRTPLYGGDSSYTAVRTYTDGQKMLEKYHIDNEEQADTEVAASYIGKIVGAPVPAVVLLPDTDEDGNFGTLSEFIRGETAAVRLGHFELSQYEQEHTNLADRHQDEKLGLLDLLVGPSDRHSANWLITAHGPVGIDYANAGFGGYSDSPFRPPTRIPPDEAALIEYQLRDLHSKRIIDGQQLRNMLQILHRLRVAA